MKTSNKILLSILLVCFGFFIGSHFILYGKYRRGDFLAASKVEGFFFHEYNKLPAVQYVQLDGLDACEIIPSNVFKMSIEKSNLNDVYHHVSGDTLYVNSNDKWSHWATARVKLYLPDVKLIHVSNCNVTLRGSHDSSGSRSYRLELNNGHLFTRYFYTDSALNKYFDTLLVNAANRSEVVLYKRDYFASIQLNLSNSSFQERNAKHTNINITKDSSSTIITGGKDYYRVIY